MRLIGRESKLIWEIFWRVCMPMVRYSVSAMIPLSKWEGKVKNCMRRKEKKTEIKIAIIGQIKSRRKNLFKTLSFTLVIAISTSVLCFCLGCFAPSLVQFATAACSSGGMATMIFEITFSPCWVSLFGPRDITPFCCHFYAHGHRWSAFSTTQLRPISSYRVLRSSPLRCPSHNSSGFTTAHTTLHSSSSQPEHNCIICDGFPPRLASASALSRTTMAASERAR